MKTVIFQAQAKEDINHWSVADKKTLRKIDELIKDIDRSPFKGIGKPEPLKYQYKGFWSRRINREHRLIYQISLQNDIVIISCKGHYSN